MIVLLLMSSQTETKDLLFVREEYKHSYPPRSACRQILFLFTRTKQSELKRDYEVRKT